MLRLLRIRNLAVIEAVEVEFEPGFNVLTGETGAGKSIVVEAVGLLLGARASADLVRTGESQATIEALFDDVDGSEVLDPSRGVELGPQSLIRQRRISRRPARFVTSRAASSRSTDSTSIRHCSIRCRTFRSSTATPTSRHSRSASPRRGDDAPAARAARPVAHGRSGKGGASRAARISAERDREGQPVAGEDEELAATKQVLANAERVQRLCEESYAALYDSDEAVLAGLGNVWKRVGELASTGSAVRELPGGPRRNQIPARGPGALPEELRGRHRRLARRLQQVEDRLASLERLKRKYGPSLDEVIAKGRELPENGIC